VRSDGGRRVLIAVLPLVVQGALAALVAAAGVGDIVVELHGQPLQGHAARYDVAIVTGALPDNVRADVLIVLPGTEGTAGTASVTTVDGTRVRQVSSPGQVLDLLGEFFPSVAPTAP
jgi:hypothetical protein